MSTAAATTLSILKNFCPSIPVFFFLLYFFYPTIIFPAQVISIEKLSSPIFLIKFNLVVHNRSLTQNFMALARDLATFFKSHLTMTQ
jgi:hypothetical protein